MEDQDRGGVLVRFAEGATRAPLVFIPALVARRLTALTSLTEVPGVPLPVAGIALADGAVVTVLALSGSVPPAYTATDDWPVPGADRAILCDLGGLSVAVTGGLVLATGWFEPGPEGFSDDTSAVIVLAPFTVTG